MAGILIVEDEFLIAEGIQEILEKLGYTVVGIESSGSKAIDKLKDTEPDLILMDINLKGDMDGIDTVHRIKKHFNIPVIYVSAYGEDQLIERAQITEPYGYIIKPIKERELKATIKMALYKSHIDKKLSSVKAMLQTVFNSIGIGIIITGSTGNVILMNPIAIKITGWNKEDAIGKPIGELFRVEENVEEDSISDKDESLLELSSEALGTQLISQGSVPKKIINFGINNNATLTRRDKEKLSVYGSISPVKSKNKIIGSVIAFQRVSLHKEIESHGLLQSGIKTDTSSLLDGENVTS